ncbi:MAG: dihydroxyacetone kinase phosphoryl donor subunit DhaM [Caldilineaceae bacterium]
MVNLVLVSHAQEIALGTKMLAQQMTTGSVQIEAAGGIAEPTSTPEETVFALGTDASRIATAIERCWTADGVLVLVDLGSAVLSAELALELLSDEMREVCLISNAPLVEGTIIAALEASLGHTLERVNEAAEGIAQIPKVIRSN